MGGRWFHRVGPIKAKAQDLVIWQSILTVETEFHWSSEHRGQSEVAEVTDEITKVLEVKPEENRQEHKELHIRLI